MKLLPIFIIASTICSCVILYSSFSLISYENLVSVTSNHQDSTHGSSIWTAAYQQDYESKLSASLNPLAYKDAEKAFHIRQFYAGLCNQQWRFIGMIFVAMDNNYKQIIEESVRWKDTYGTDEPLETKRLWDVLHWNSYYPQLPKFSSFDESQDVELTFSTQQKVLNGTQKDSDSTSPLIFEMKEITYRDAKVYEQDSKSFGQTTHPHALGKKAKELQNQFQVFFNQLVKTKDMHSSKALAYKTILKGALKPHPFLQDIIDAKVLSLNQEKSGKGYMTIHLRIEPDMLAQRKICADVRVLTLDKILDLIYEKYPEPPIDTVLIMFSRKVMETFDKKSVDPKKEWGLYNNQLLNRKNLDMLDDLLEKGMYNGRVRVMEAGSELVQQTHHPYYSTYSAISGAIVNFFLAVESKIFIGAEISSWSSFVANTRFFRGSLDRSFFYRPTGLVQSTTEDLPHRFEC